ncbi:MAG: transposase [Sedimenticola sp.]
MPRKPRFVIPGVPLHIVQRGHSHEPVFFEAEDYSAYLGWLKDGADRYQCEIHAYVLMTNHVHILVTPGGIDSVTRMIQYVGRHYVPFINQKYGKSGSLWEGRYKASLVQEETYLLSCMRYIELNPVRAGMVKSPAHYRWSSYRANAQGKENELIKKHRLYQKLDKNAFGRQTAYKALFKAYIDLSIHDDIRSAWQTGTPLGNDLFKEKVESTLKQKVGQARRGRPNKQKDSC